MIDLIKNGLRVWKKYGFKQFYREVSHFMKGKKIAIKHSLFKEDKGENIFSKDWDLLIILDACRFDLLTETEDNFDFFNMDKDDYYYSLGSSSDEWMEKNFVEEYGTEMSKTSYVTANLFSEDFVEEEDFNNVVEIWKNGWDEDLSTTPAETVTEAAVREYRNNNPDRMIVHYMQPHLPFVGSDIKFEKQSGKKDISEKQDEWDKFNKGLFYQVRDGEVGKDKVWGAYRDNLEYVLKEVDRLCNNVGYENAIITADHGNAFGEKGIYSHPSGVPIDVLRKVPWVSIKCSDNKTISEISELGDNEDIEDSTVEKRLSDLGYI